MNYSRPELAPELFFFPARKLLSRGAESGVPKRPRVLAELPPVRCRRRVATVVSSNAQPASGLPVPSPSSRPSGTDYTQFTDLCYYRTVFHPLRPVLFIHPVASPFFSELRAFSRPTEGLGEAAHRCVQAGFPRILFIYNKKIIEREINDKESVRRERYKIVFNKNNE